MILQSDSDYEFVQFFHFSFLIRNVKKRRRSNLSGVSKFERWVHFAVQDGVCDTLFHLIHFTSHLVERLKMKILYVDCCLTIINMQPLIVH